MSRDVIKELETSIGSVRKPRDQASHEILDMHKVFAVIDLAKRQRRALKK